MIVLMLHLTAMNVLYPKIVGARVHLNPLVVTFSLMFWGFLWDAAGLLLAIPITAGIKAVCDNVAGLRPSAASSATKLSDASAVSGAAQRPRAICAAAYCVCRRR